MPRAYTNPFNPQTPIGAGLQNIAQAMFGGPTPNEVIEREAKAEHLRAQAENARLHGELYRGQTAKTAAETLGLQRINQRLSPEGMDETAALAHVVPVSTVQALRGYVGGRNPMPPAVPGGGSVQDIADTLYSMNIGSMDKTSTAGDIELARNRRRQQRSEEAAISGELDPIALASGAFARTGHNPYSQTANGTSVIDITGRQRQDSPNALSWRSTQDSQVKRDLAAAGASGAAAGASSASAALSRGRLDEILSGNAHPWVNVLDKDAMGQDIPGTIKMVPRTQLTGRTPTADPSVLALRRAQAELAGARTGAAEGAGALSNARAGAIPSQIDLNNARADAANSQAGLNDVRADAGGFAPRAAGRQGAPRRITANDRVLIQKGIDDVLAQMDVGTMDDATKVAVQLEAERQWQAGAAGHQSAAMAAINAVAPQGFEDRRSGIPLVPSRFQPRGGVPAAGPTARGAVTPGPARIASDADYARLPSGSTYIAPDGTTRRKP